MSNAGEKLMSAGTSPELIREIHEIFEELDRARFAPTSSEKEKMDVCLASLEKLFSRLEKVKVR